MDKNTKTLLVFAGIIAGIILLIILLSGPNQNIPEITDNSSKVQVYFFWGNGCPHCEEAKPFIYSLEKKYPNVEVKAYEVWYNKDNLELLKKVSKAYSTQAEGVPMIFIGDKYWAGYSKSMDAEMEAKIQAETSSRTTSPAERLA